jgi:hypothetical protein
VVDQYIEDVDEDPWVVVLILKDTLEDQVALSSLYYQMMDVVRDGNHEHILKEDTTRGENNVEVVHTRGLPVVEVENELHVVVVEDVQRI